jgi:hypothetical protein
MIQKLKNIEKDQILDLLDKPEIWKTKLIDYEPPIVERVYTTIGDCRLSLHWIHPCTEALVHPHVWESGMHIIEGTYEMGLFYPDGEGMLQEVSKIICYENFYYEMMNRKAEHYVKPIGDICKTVMLTGQPIWKENDMIVNKALVDLSEERKGEILNYYKKYYLKFNGRI